MIKTFDKTYKIGDGYTLRLKLVYNLIYTTHELDMDVVNIGDLELGYEDEDWLVFYPNVMHFEFDDFERKNYFTLKNAFGETPVNKLEDNHAGEVWENGIKIFDGYIDKKSIHYSNSTGTMSFDLVDYTSRLKSMPVASAPPDWAGGINDIHYIYRQIYPNLNYFATNNSALYTSSGFNGIYLKHNWVFRGKGTIGVPEFDRSWDINTDPEGYKNVAVFRQHIYENAEYLSDVLKNYAREFGMTIGSAGYNKVHIVKSFVKPSSVIARDLAPVLEDFDRDTWLSNVSGVRNIAQYDDNNINVEGVFPLINTTDPSSDPVNVDDVIDFRSIFKSTVAQGSEGASTFRVVQNGNVQTVLNGIFDPDLLPYQYQYIERILTRLTYLSRIRPRDKYELQLDDTNYGMHEYYYLAQPGIPSVVLKPINIVRRIVERKTTIQALEVGL